MGTNLHSLKAPANSRHRKKRVGRGQGSGWGKTAGRGGKGQKARTGNMNFGGFEGGQMPLQRRLPKYGFKNIFRVEYVPVNLARLETLFNDGDTVDLDTLKEKGVLSKKGQLVKILGVGELSRKLTVHAHKFSASAREAIEKVGGKAEEIELHPSKVEGSDNA